MIHPFIILSPFTRIIGSAHIHTAAPPMHRRFWHEGAPILFNTKTKVSDAM